MPHDPLTLYELEMHMRRARELRAAYVADISGQLFDWIRQRIARIPGSVTLMSPSARRRIAAIVIALAAVFLLGGCIAFASAHAAPDLPDICAERQRVVTLAIEERADASDPTGILARATTTMQTAQRYCAQGRGTSAVTLYNYILRRVKTLAVRRPNGASINAGA